MGSVGLDYLAAVAAFPKPDDKLRTERLEVRKTGEDTNKRVFFFFSGSPSLSIRAHLLPAISPPHP